MEDYSHPQVPSTSYPTKSYPSLEHHSLYLSFNCHLFKDWIIFNIIYLSLSLSGNIEDTQEMLVENVLIKQWIGQEDLK